MKTCLAFALVLSACADPPQPEIVTIIELRATPSRALDLLFVIDDSPTMIDNQANLAENFTHLLDALEAAPGGLPDLHVGVISPDMGTKGSTAPEPGPAIGAVGNGGCANTGDRGNLQISGAPVAGAFLRDVETASGTRERNYTGTLAEAFAQMARIGTGGCGFEQPLHAMRRALENNAANAGFVRDDAQLAVVFVTDEDDCSFTDPGLLGPESATLGPQQSFRCTRFGVTCTEGGATSDEMNELGPKMRCAARTDSPYLEDVMTFRDFLYELKGPQVVVAGIVGDPTPVVVEERAFSGGPLQRVVASSCTYEDTAHTEVADPAIRLGHFLSLFERSTWTSICERDLTAPLARIAELVNQPILGCIGATIHDAVDCYVEDEVGTMTTRIDACGAPPCFRLVTDPSCPLGGRQKLELERTAPLDPATITRLRCRVGA